MQPTRLLVASFWLMGVSFGACAQSLDHPPPPPPPTGGPTPPTMTGPRDAGRRDGGGPRDGGMMAMPDGGGPGTDAGGGTDAGPMPSANCGNRMVDPGEACDDGNMVRLDGCAACETLPAVVIQFLRLVIDEGMDGIDDRDRARWCDVNGDGTTDNALAAVGVQTVLDTIFDPDLTGRGTWPALTFDRLDLTALATGGSGSDDDVEVAGIIVQDADSNEANNFTSPMEGGEFVTAPESFDAMGNVRAGAMRIGPMNHLELTVDRLAFAYRTDMGAPIRLAVRSTRLAGDLVVSAGRLGQIVRGTLCGAIEIRSFASIPSPVAGETLAQSLIQGLSVGGVSLPPARPDIDLDGDGLETFEVVGGMLTACFDGDGTRIAGADCVTDPRIQDGLSIFATFQGPGAEILGAQM